MANWFADHVYINTSVSKLKGIAARVGEMRFVICVTNNTISACDAEFGIHADIKQEADYYGHTNIHGYLVYTEETGYRYRISAFDPGLEGSYLGYDERHTNPFIQRMEKYGFVRSARNFDCEW